MLLVLVSLSLAGPPKVDLDPNGNVITVRPEADHVVAVFSATGERFQLPEAMSQPMWLVHPESWRQAVAMAARVETEQALVPELQKEVARLEGELSAEKGLRTELRLDLQKCETSHEVERKMLRRSRLHWTLGAGTSMLVIGGLIGVFVVPL